MSNLSPIFPMLDPQHYFFTDYDHNPKLQYFQVLEEAKKQRKERAAAAAPTTHQFKKKHNSCSRSKRWLKNAFGFIRGKLGHCPIHQNSQEFHDLNSRVYQVRAALSGPLYLTESTSYFAAPYRTTRSCSSSGQQLSTKDKIIPYISLRQHNMDHHPRKLTTTPQPVYLVT